jgi:hypothetical protein
MLISRDLFNNDASGVHIHSQEFKASIFSEQMCCYYAGLSLEADHLLLRSII